MNIYAEVIELLQQHDYKHVSQEIEFAKGSKQQITSVKKFKEQWRRRS